MIQKHWASHLHYDFRLELDGVLVSWAVPKGPSLDPKAKRMAVHVEDHPVSYGRFEGTIPPKQYGAGTVIVWDHGTWEPVGDARAGLQSGKLVFQLHGHKLAGLWELVRTSKRGEKKDQWLLFKKRDAWARPIEEYDVVVALPDSVIEHPLGLAEDREPRIDHAAKARAGEPDLSQAVKSRLPAKLAPQLATLVRIPPPGTGWLAETKFDGYRMLCRIEGGKAKLITRNGHDWTAKMKSLACEVEKLGINQAWLDGEIVVMNERGAFDFNALQNAIASPRDESSVYFVFDAPFLGDYDLRPVPLEARRAALSKIFDSAGSERVRFSPTIDAPAAPLLEAACKMEFEGIVLKRADAPYVSERTDTWVKLKCLQRQEFVVCGFTDRTGTTSELGSLLLGVYDGDELKVAGNVGTGWDAKTGRALHRKLTRIEVKTPPSAAPQTAKLSHWSKAREGARRWVKPHLVAEVAFAQWTPNGQVRHASFKGLRTDKPPTAITREVAVSPLSAPAKTKPGAKPGAKRSDKLSAKPSALKLTHPDRVIDPSTGLKKIDLFRYFESVAEWILPHLKGRPVSLVRAPQGITGELFFQKHPETRMPGVTELDPALWPGHAPLLAVNSAEALLAAVQMNAVEFHTWNSTVRAIDKPNRIVFDLDPGEGVSWGRVVEAAVLTRTLLGELGLDAWVKTSGGKGIHVVVPLAPKLDYVAVKAFSQAVVVHLAQTIPSRFVAKSGPSNRVGKIFVDYLRNGHGQTTACAFSARVRPGIGVSMPVAWDDIHALKSSAQWTIATARDYLSLQRSDPWAGYWKSRQTLTAAIKSLGVGRTG